MTWASIARGDYRRPDTTTNTPNTGASANQSSATANPATTPVQAPKPPPTRSVAPQPPPTHIVADAWPLVGQTAEEARKLPPTPSSAGNNSTTPTSAAVSSTRPVASLPAIAASNGISQSSAPVLTPAPPPRRSAWGPPDPPPRPPSNTVAPQPMAGASPAVSLPSPLHIPPLAMGPPSVPTDPSESSGTVPTSPDGSAPIEMREVHDNQRLLRVQEYYVTAFQRSPSDFVANFCTNLAFQAGVCSAGLNLDMSDRTTPKLVNRYTNYLGNDPIFYLTPTSAPVPTDWAAAATTITPSASAQARNSPRTAPPNNGPPPTGQQHRSKHGNGGRQRHGGNRVNGDANSHRSNHGYRNGGAAGGVGVGNSMNGGMIGGMVHANGGPHVQTHPFPVPIATHFPVVSYIPQHQLTYAPAAVPFMTARVTRRHPHDIPLRPSVTMPPRHIVETVDAEVERMLVGMQPSEEERESRERLLVLLREAMSKEWSGATVSCFGSAANGLALPNGDVDICVMVPMGTKRILKDPSDSPEVAENHVQVLHSIRDLLQSEHNMEIKSDLCHARVPILKLKDQISGFNIDICINNHLVDHNTALVGTYMDLDPRVRPLCLLIKNWAKQRDVNDTYRGTLSSYAFVLLVICFCQTRSPPVLPCLQRMVNGVAVDDEEDIPKKMVLHADNANSNPVEYNVYFDRSKQNWQSENTDSIGRLLLDFFKFYCFEFDYTKSVVSVRKGGLFPREKNGWDRATVLRKAEDAEREFRFDKEQYEMEEELLAEQRRIRQQTPEPMEETIQTASEDSGSNGVADLANAAAKVTLDASAAPFLPLSPAPNGVEVSSGNTTDEQQPDADPAATSSSSKSESIHSQTSIPSQKEEVDLVADLPEAIANGTGAETDKPVSISGSSSVTSADASPAVRRPRSPAQIPPPCSRALRSGRPRSVAGSENALDTTRPDEGSRSPLQPNASNLPVRDRLRKPRPVERHAFCIEDPFNLQHDLSRGADEDTIYVLREEFFRGYSILSETGNIPNLLISFNVEMNLINAQHQAAHVGRTNYVPPHPSPIPMTVVPHQPLSAPARSIGGGNSNGRGNSSGGNTNRKHTHEKRQGGGPARRGRAVAGTPTQR